MYSDAIEDVAVPASLTVQYAEYDGVHSCFSNMPDSFKNLTITAGGTTVGNLFQSSKVISVTIPEGVTTIGDNAFSQCLHLTSVTILDGVTTIGDNAFDVCNSLASVTIPVSVTSIGSSAFTNSASSLVISYEGTKSQWDAIEKSSQICDYRKTLQCSDGTFTLYP